MRSAAYEAGLTQTTNARIQSLCRANPRQDVKRELNQRQRLSDIKTTKQDRLFIGDAILFFLLLALEIRNSFLHPFRRGGALQEVIEKLL